MILAIDSSRLARDTDLAGVINYEVRKAGARIEYSKIPGGGNAAMDVLVAGVMRAIDAFHSLISKEKSLAGMRTNIELSHRAGGRAPLGYAVKHVATGALRQGEPVRKSHPVLDPAWAPRVKRYLELRARNAARGEAARKSGLAEKPQTSLIGVERNALVYAGIVAWNKHTDRKLGAEHRYRPRSEWVIQSGTHEALITENAAEKLMERAFPKTRAKRGPSGRFLLTGFLFTPSGEPMGCRRARPGERGGGFA